MMTKRVQPLLLLATASISLFSCKEEGNKEVVQVEEETTPGIELKYMDTTVSPKSNFYDYANGNWMKETEIPEDRTSWGGFQVLRKSTDDDVLAIIDNAQKSEKYGPETDQAKALAVFETQLDTVARNEAGLKPLQPALEKIKSIKDVKDLQEVIAKNPATVSDPFFGIAAFSNPSNSNINSAYITTGGLGLPNREYYTDQDEKSKEIRQQYVDHITRMLQYLGDSEESAKKQAEEILAFETRLAEPRLDKVASRDFRNFNNPKTIAEIQEMVPAIDWKKIH